TSMIGSGTWLPKGTTRRAHGSTRMRFCSHTGRCCGRLRRAQPERCLSVRAMSLHPNLETVMMKGMQHARFGMLVGAFLLISSTACAGDIKDTVKESFKVRPGGTLFIDIDHGNVEIESTRDEAVRIEVERVVD